MNRWDTLYKRIKDIDHPVGAEIGVYKGDMSRNILKLHSGLELYMIDAWSSDTYIGKDDQAVSGPYRKIYTENRGINYSTACESVEEFKNRAKIIKLFSYDASKLFDNNFFDFVFIDAAHDHESVKQDIELWLPKIKKGGFICGHDYGCWEGVTRAVDEFFPDAEIDYDFTWFWTV